ncbi:MAG: Rne/Rng family ribonuclease [Armatimonadota bacterium]|nr:Rne/Rng family ribonuclease [Armatimonadota bacterium]MDR7427802.1 Rne/Rng family ribonuclease [Armatimonadota bacterium]MDR7468894.1 Rne/Rng family ribonuclease [Armatimonadota bacterium]MDR7474865.1 Rne/Rng family ribonuclease [Armatimonadota bacterium]MDR7539684.1 Rne/Rng family ribonuclease [Armatimonadota bacterium]
MGREIFANVEPYETRVAVTEDGTLVNIFVERGEPLAGNIYKGKVVNVLPGMEAAFVDIGLERNAFLHVADIRSQRLAGEELDESFGRGAIADRLRPGQEILVQVTKEPMGSKGARVTTYIALPAHYLVLMPTVNYVGVSRRIEAEAERKRLRQIAEAIKPEKMGVIVRTAAEGVSEKELKADVDFLLSVWNRVTERARNGRAPVLIYQDVRLIRRVVRDLLTEDVQRFVVDSPEEYGRILDLLSSFAPALKSRVVLYKGEEPIFEHFGVEKELERALRRKVWLRSGGYIVIDRTEALTVIDVNTGKYVGKTDLASTIFKTNLEAVEEIVRQIVLRDIGGIILVDFIDMENERHRKRVLQALEEAVRRDRAKIHIIDLTQLGLVEITRKRVHQDLEEVMRIPCPYCEGRGRVLSPETMSLRARREVRRLARTSRARALLVEVHPQVHALLARDGDAWLHQLEESSGKRILLRPRDGLHLERITVTEAAEAAALEREEALVGAGRRTQLRWLEEEPEEAVELAEEEEEEYGHAALVGASSSGGILARLRQLFAVRRS